MTACDLSACTKPWDIQLEIVKVIYQEFYAEVSVIPAIKTGWRTSDNVKSTVSQSHNLSVQHIANSVIKRYCSVGFI